MLNARSALDDISFMNYSYGLALFLIVAGAFSDEQDLPTRMDMPVEFCTRRKRCNSYVEIESIVSFT